MTHSVPSYLPSKFQRIHIELTNRCNFSCVFCPTGKMTRPQEFMDPDLACSAIDQIAELDLADKITFHVMGEPLLHPHFFRILLHAKERGVPVGLTTNAALLSEANIRRLAESDLHQIDISLQTPDRESFHLTRGTRIDFDEYRRRLLDLLAAMAQRPAQPIFKIRIMTTRFASGMRKKLGIPNFLGTSEALRRTVIEWTDMIYERLGKTPIPRDQLLRRARRVGIHGWNVIELAPKIFVETYVLTDWGNAFAEDGIIEARHGYCFGMRDHFAILCSGDVVLCCIDFDGRTAVGNLRESSLVEVLNSPELRRIMDGFRRNALIHPHCRRCLGSRSRLSAAFKPVMSVVGLKLLKPLFYRKYQLFG
jgi:MoaA/NifB/PqqE/SkfB family radical SAM enzyme